MENNIFLRDFFFGLNLVFHFKGVGAKDILETVLSVSYKAYWYVTAYVAITLLAPFLNTIIEVITERQYKFLIVVLLLMVTVPATFYQKQNHTMMKVTFIIRSDLIHYWFLQEGVPEGCKKDFIVTNMDIKPYQIIQFYCGRGKMENFIKESKSGFDFAAVSK